MDNAEIRRRNLRLLVEQHGASKVAEELGISRSQLSQIAGRNPSRAIGTTLARRVEEAFKKPAGWIDVLQDSNNVIGAPPAQGRRVPVISYAQAGEPQEAVDAYHTGAGLADLDTDYEVGPHAFALELRGDSMEPTFSEGDRVVIDPSIAPMPGDFVVAKIGDEVTFKKYRPRGISTNGNQVFELVPLNEDYATIRSDAVEVKIIGTMVEHRRYRRRR